jgi:predicted site-specific integrase-resolvase
MLKRGILPVPSERSATGRWYVMLPPKQLGKIALYTRAAPGPRQIASLNDQIAVLSEWAATRQRHVFTVVREIADPLKDPMPRLERLLADYQITEILIDNPAIIGVYQFSLLVAALAPQGRVITPVHMGKVAE